MEYSEKKTEYNLNYAKTKLKRIPLDIQNEKYQAGESVNGYIKKAIDQRIERDNK